MTLTHSSRINPTRTPGRASRLRLALRKPSLMHASRSSPAAAASARTDPPGPKTAAFLERHHHTTSCYHTPILYQLYHTPILYSTAMHCTVATRTPFPCQACSVQPSTQHDTSRVVCRNAACNRRASSGVPGAIASHTAPPTNPSDRPRAANEPQTRKFGSQIDSCFQ